jgi:hypothetical protein
MKIIKRSLSHEKYADGHRDSVSLLCENPDPRSNLTPQFGAITVHLICHLESSWMLVIIQGEVNVPNQTNLLN